MTDNRTLLLIPARMAATRLPGKPLLDIAGLPMIVHVLRRATEAALGRVAGATHPSGSYRIFEPAETLDPRREADIVVNLQGDFPTITPQTIRDVLPPLADGAVDIATLASEIHTEDEDLAPSVVKAVGT